MSNHFGPLGKLDPIRKRKYLFFAIIQLIPNWFRGWAVVHLLLAYNLHASDVDLLVLVALVLKMRCLKSSMTWDFLRPWLTLAFSDVVLHSER